MTSKAIAPAALVALNEALTNIYWYKGDLRSFLTSTLSNPGLLAGLNWEDYKRNIVSSLIERLAARQDLFQADLLRLMSEVSKISDFSHLERLDGGKEKVKLARQSVTALHKLTAAHDALYEKQRELEERRERAHLESMQKSAVRHKLEEIARDYYILLGPGEPQNRGFRLERIIRELFELFDLDPRASFRIVGEQIDGAFTFEGIDYLLEAKWQKDPVAAGDLDGFAGKLGRKLENTLGLFLSINGFSGDGVKAHSSGRRLMILMDGSDLMAVLEGRIDLIQLLLRKRRHASQTGNIYLLVHEVL